MKNWNKSLRKFYRKKNKFLEYEFFFQAYILQKVISSPNSELSFGCITYMQNTLSKFEFLTVKNNRQKFKPHMMWRKTKKDIQLFVYVDDD